MVFLVTYTFAGADAESLIRGKSGSAAGYSCFESTADVVRVSESYFKVTMGAGVNTWYAQKFSASADYSHTAKLVNFDVIYNGNVLPATSYTLLTASGYDYMAPVPEPETWALMVGGVGILGWQLRHRALLS